MEIRTVPAQQMNMATLNGLPVEDAENALLACCASRRWAERVLAGRPYRSAAELFAAADAALAALGEPDLDEAMAGHPRIGERAAGPHSAASRREQAAVLSAGPDVLAALAEGNRQYEERFGHVYLVCADGRSGDELLKLLRQRLSSDPETERKQVRAELGRINRIRLGRLIADDGGTPS
jgi:2-oxo-4-hydroxy-4-carboxy-5-ureidoimidazoline decarboxylase